MRDGEHGESGGDIHDGCCDTDLEVIEETTSTAAWPQLYRNYNCLLERFIWRRRRKTIKRSCSLLSTLLFHLWITGHIDGVSNLFQWLTSMPWLNSTRIILATVHTEPHTVDKYWILSISVSCRSYANNHRTWADNEGFQEKDSNLYLRQRDEVARIDRTYGQLRCQDSKARLEAPSGL